MNSLFCSQQPWDMGSVRRGNGTEKRKVLALLKSLCECVWKVCSVLFCLLGCRRKVWVYTRWLQWKKIPEGQDCAHVESPSELADVALCLSPFWPSVRTCFVGHSPWEYHLWAAPCGGCDSSFSSLRTFVVCVNCRILAHMLLPSLKEIRPWSAASVSSLRWAACLLARMSSLCSFFLNHFLSVWRIWRGVNQVLKAPKARIGVTAYPPESCPLSSGHLVKF